VIVDQGNGPILYWGVLADYFFNADGTLEKIVLEDAQRRDLSDDDEFLEGSDDFSDNDDSSGRDQKGHKTPIEDERFYPIRGHFLIIRYEDVVNLNIEYLRLTEASNDSEGNEEAPADDNV
jgi:hypothetical protein